LDCKAIFIGISTGGPKALTQVIPQIPAGFPIPIVVVQHMPPLFTATMAKSLDKTSQLSAVEVSDRMPMVAGGLYIAPGGKQLGVTTNTQGELLADVNDSPAMKGCKPSVDYLLGSVPPNIAKQSLAIIMTGMGDDGRIGCEKMRTFGTTVWAQSETSCTVYGMPRQIAENGLADFVFDLNDLPGLLNQLARKSMRSRPTRPSGFVPTSAQPIPPYSATT
jgi:two-component system chemotaxis response regulator CheB